MKLKNWFTRRKAAGTISIVAVIALLLTGTFAWYDFSQAATNNFKGPFVREVLLHDDFDEEAAAEWDEYQTINKDVYVENTGNTAVYVRVKLTENMTFTYADGTTQEIYADQVNSSFSGVGADDEYATWNLGEVMSMADWIAADKPTGAFWVLDTDGWAYWAEMLGAEEITALLLDSVTLSNPPNELFDYSIDVQLEAISDYHLYYWYEGGTVNDDYEINPAGDDAQKLLDILSGKVPDAPVYKVGDVITIGNHNWIILAIDEETNQMTVLSQNVVGTTRRNGLSNYYNPGHNTYGFSSEERALIIGNLSILSSSQIQGYVPTPLATLATSNNNAYWLSDSRGGGGGGGGGQARYSYVNTNGNITETTQQNPDPSYGVRPVMSVSTLGEYTIVN